MLVFVTPKIKDKRVPYSYRARATVPASKIKNSRVTSDLKSTKPGEIVVLGKKHSREDAEYLIAKEINFIVDIADDKFDQFKHWYFTIPNANAVTTTCHRLREIIQEETGVNSYVIPDPTERPRGEPKFEVRNVMNAFYYGSDGNYSKIMWPEVKNVLNQVKRTSIKIMTNKPKHPPKKEKLARAHGGYWMLPNKRDEVVKEGLWQYQQLIDWDFDLQGKMVEQSDFVVLPVVDDRHSQCKGNNRPVDALQQGRMVLTNPGIPSYYNLLPNIYWGHFYETYTEMINNPQQVVERIRQAQIVIDNEYTPEAVAKKWEQVYENTLRNDI